MHKLFGIVKLISTLSFIFLSRQFALILLEKISLGEYIDYFTIGIALITFMYTNVPSRARIVFISPLIVASGNSGFNTMVTDVIYLVGMLSIVSFYALFLRDIFVVVFKYFSNGYGSKGIVNPNSKSFYTSEAWRKLRLVALDIHGKQCMNPKCGSTHELQVDHIRPRSKFPNLALDLNNLQILCGPCNRIKSNTTIVDYR